MKFPVYVHGMLKMETFSGVIRPEKESAPGRVHASRPSAGRSSRGWKSATRPRWPARWSMPCPTWSIIPTAAPSRRSTASCPRSSRRRFCCDMKLDLKDIQKKRTNLNAQEIGDDQKRAADWRSRRHMSRATARVKNPVFDEDEVHEMVKDGVERLAEMQCSDGGWGWFSGWGEQSWPHTTALVVHGLQIARPTTWPWCPACSSAASTGSSTTRTSRSSCIRNAEKKEKGIRWKEHADNLDAFVYMVLVDAGVKNADMRDFLYRDRTELAVYAKAMFGLALDKQGEKEKLDMILRNIEPVRRAGRREPDRLAQAARRQLVVVLVRQRVRGAGLLPEAARRRPIRRARWPRGWSSTCSTTASTPPTGTPPATRPSCIEALADFLKASGEDKPDMTVEVCLDGKLQKEVEITPQNLFTFDNKLVLEGDARRRPASTRSSSRKKGTGPLYFNAYLTNFTLEDFDHQGRPGDQGRPQVLQARRGRQDGQGRRLARPGRRPEGREVRAPGTRRTWRRSRAATWSRSSWRSTARTTTSTSCSRT